MFFLRVLEGKQFSQTVLFSGMMLLCVRDESLGTDGARPPVRQEAREEAPRPVGPSPVAQLHRFCRRRGLVQQGGVGHVHACDVAHHGLVVEQALQSPLRHFWLVWSILGDPVKDTKATSKL